MNAVITDLSDFARRRAARGTTDEQDARRQVRAALTGNVKPVRIAQAEQRADNLVRSGALSIPAAVRRAVAWALTPDEPTPPAAA